MAWRSGEYIYLIYIPLTDTLLAAGRMSLLYVGLLYWRGSALTEAGAAAHPQCAHWGPPNFF